MGLKRPTGEALANAVRDRTGHAFRDLRLLETALTHSSAVKAVANNERLEFLGDRVLGLVVADMLFHLFPDASEGEIAPRFNALVDARTCAEVGVELGLEQLVRADAALKARTRGSGANYLADAVEALIAAIYIDGGMDAARGFVLRFWEPRSRAVREKPVNPKGELQEWVARSKDTRDDGCTRYPSSVATSVSLAKPVLPDSSGTPRSVSNRTSRSSRDGVRTARDTAPHSVVRGLGVHRRRAVGWNSNPV